MQEFDFSQMAQWADMVGDRLDTVVARSVARVIEAQQLRREHGGQMPYKTGELRDSLEINVSGTTLRGGEAYLDLFIMDWVGDQVTWKWNAPYAYRRNYGFTGTDSLGRQYNDPGNFFMEFGAQQWDYIVSLEAWEVYIES